MTEKYSKYNSYVEYLRAEKIGEDFSVNFKMPIPSQNGGVTFPGVIGKLLWAFDDGVLLRTESGEGYYAFKDMQFSDFPSAIKMAKAGIVQPQASA